MTTDNNKSCDYESLVKNVNYNGKTKRCVAEYNGKIKPSGAENNGKQSPGVQRVMEK